MFKTDRLSIRELSKEDFSDLKEIYSEDNLKYIPASDFSEETLLRKINDDNYYFVAIYNDKVIGILSLFKSEMKDTYEIGFVFNNKHHRQGFGKETVSEIIKYAFEVLKAHRIVANVDTRNIASIKLCEALKMRKEAHFIKDYFMKGEWTDSYIFALLSSEI